MPTQSSSVPGFLPTVNGLPFVNTWPPGPDYTFSVLGQNITRGAASNGLCGGMVYTVKDLFDTGLLPPAGSINPANGSALFNYLVARLTHSFDEPDVNQYLSWIQMSDHDTDEPGRATRSIWRERSHRGHPEQRVLCVSSNRRWQLVGLGRHARLSHECRHGDKPGWTPCRVRRERTHRGRPEQRLLCITGDRRRQLVGLGQRPRLPHECRFGRDQPARSVRSGRGERRHPDQPNDIFLGSLVVPTGLSAWTGMVGYLC